jgi:hypothetical protein
MLSVGLNIIMFHHKIKLQICFTLKFFRRIFDEISANFEHVENIYFSASENKMSFFIELSNKI